MKNLLIIVMACYGLSARAQVDGSRNFVYLFSDSLVYANKIRLHPGFNGEWQVRADSRRIPNDRIKFFNNDDGFFANTRRMNALRVSSFSERIIEGRINLYQQNDYEPTAYGRWNRHGRTSNQVLDHRMFYNKGYGDLKKVAYENLYQDMSDDPESMGLLDGYRKSISSRNILYAAAGASIVGSLVSFLVSSNKIGITKGEFGSAPQLRKASFSPTLILLGLSGGFAIGGYTMHVSSYRNLENAVEAYNR